MKSKTGRRGANCGIARALGVVGDRWSLLIIRDAFGGKERFGEFQKGLGLAKNILSSRLKKLVAEGILHTVPDSEESTFKSYVLTEKGERLGVVLAALWQWGEQNCFAKGEVTQTLVDRRTNEPLARISLKTATGRSLSPRDVNLIARDAAQPRVGR